MVYEILSTGAENAQTARTLCGLLGLTPRELTIAIERERREGRPICSSTGRPAGYYIAANRQEMAAFCRSLRHRAGEIHKTREACINMLDKLPAK